MNYLNVLRLCVVCLIIIEPRYNFAEEDVRDFDFSRDAEYDSEEAGESRQYTSYAKPSVSITKPKGITNSHRPQYNIDSYEDDPYPTVQSPIDEQTNEAETEDFIDEELDNEEDVNSFKFYSPSSQIRAKEAMIRDAVVRALERKDHIKKIAQILPIIRAMTATQRLAFASLVANQVTTPLGRKGLNLVQVRSMFGNNDNATADLMLPILFDMANLFRRASRSGKETRAVSEPVPQMLRRSDDNEDDIIWDDDPSLVSDTIRKESNITSSTATVKSTKARSITRPNRNIRHNRTQNTSIQSRQNATHTNTEKTLSNSTDADNFNDKIKNRSRVESTISPVALIYAEPLTSNDTQDDVQRNSTTDQMAESSNDTLVSDLPVAEKLRAMNRFIDRKGNISRRPPFVPAKPASSNRRTTAEQVSAAYRKRPTAVRKLPTTTNVSEQANCQLFTHTVCLEAENYPKEAIVSSIRRNKAAAGALLADFKDQDGVDGVSAKDEATYTPEHYLNNRRGDSSGSIRDFAGAGEAGFMCPSTVKYARPQRARATSGQWKYIVNTGEHTQTLRLEKCLKPKEPCTYLTDNFKSKCVQVYNYHRLLTWDQQNGLHMDIFKVPTCCSCHIEGYSVSFPPLGHRTQESSSESFPRDDLIESNENNAYESSVQSTVVRPNLHSTPFSLNKPVDSFSVFGDNQNTIAGAGFNNHGFRDDDYNPISGSADSFGHQSYFPDNYKQGSSIRNIKKPNRTPISDGAFESSATLPSYLEPPAESSIPVGTVFSFNKGSENTINKFNNKQFKRTKRPGRRPIRKKIGSGEDLLTSGTANFDSQTVPSLGLDEINEEVVNQGKTIISSHTPGNKQVIYEGKIQLPSHSSVKTDAGVVKDLIQNKRVNYNYHPIIDFFGNSEHSEESNEPIDRGDTVSTYFPSLDTEWKPMSTPNTKHNKIGKAISNA